MPLSHGIDIVEVARIEELVGSSGARFLERCFTPAERAYADADSRRRFEKLAARFAAKEAAFKALGTGWAMGVGWTDIEVTRDDAGRPGLLVSGKAAEVASGLGIESWSVSLSHTETHAVASVIAFSGQG